MKNHKIAKWILLGLTILVDGFIIANGFVNGEASAHESGSIAKAFADIINFFFKNAINDGNFPTFSLVFRKLIGHFALFGLSGVLTSISLYFFVDFTHYFAIGLNALKGIFLAFISEIAQLFTDGRVFTFTDVCIDLSGYFLGMFFVILVILLIIRKKEKAIQK